MGEGMPHPHGDRFTVIFDMDVTFKPTGERSKMREIGLYTVEGGMVVREEFSSRDLSRFAEIQRPSVGAHTGRPAAAPSMICTNSRTVSRPSLSAYHFIFISKMPLRSSPSGFSMM